MFRRKKSSHDIADMKQKKPSTPTSARQPEFPDEDYSNDDSNGASQKGKSTDFASQLYSLKVKEPPTVPKAPLTDGDPFFSEVAADKSDKSNHQSSNTASSSSNGSDMAPTQNSLTVLLNKGESFLRIIDRMDLKQLTEEKIERQGWLVKEGKIVKSWKKRWFVLQGSTLSYYTVRTRKLKGSISLETCTVSPVSGRTDGKDCMELTYGDNDRTFFLSAENDEERLLWLVALNNKIASLKYNSMMNAKGERPDPDFLSFFAEPDAQFLRLGRPDQSPIQVETLEKITLPVKYHSKLQHLSFAHARIGDQGIKALQEALTQNTSIQILDLSYNDLGYDGIKVVSQILKNNPRIREIDLSHNNINDKSIRELSLTLLAGCKNLRRITFSHNKIGDEGATIIAQVFINGDMTVPNLELSYNEIGDKGVEQISILIASSRKITSVNLGHNQISNDGVKMLAQCFIENPDTSVTHLNLENNHIGFQGAKEIANVLTRNTKLSTVVLGGNKLGEQALDVLAQTMMKFPEFELKKIA